MFTRDVAINQLQLGLFSKIVPDIREETLFVPGAGHGHLPIWILGHLAVYAEAGQQILGGSLQHPEWMPLFGAGSSGHVEPSDSLSKQALAASITEGYSKLQQMALAATEETLNRDHGIELFAESPIKNVGDVVALLLTNHFGFHLAQLSSCRRESGFPALF